MTGCRFWVFRLHRCPTIRRAHDDHTCCSLQLLWVSDDALRPSYIKDYSRVLTGHTTTTSNGLICLGRECLCNADRALSSDADV